MTISNPLLADAHVKSACVDLLGLLASQLHEDDAGVQQDAEWLQGVAEANGEAGLALLGGSFGAAAERRKKRTLGSDARFLPFSLLLSQEVETS